MARVHPRLRGLFAQSAAITATVDRIHARVPYTGGRLAIEAIFDTVPGLLLAVADDLPAQGAMQRTGGCVRIVVRASLPRPAMRFVVAHEIGHAMLHAGHCETPTRAALARRGLEPRSCTILDREADRFAAELLAPLWAIERFLADRKIGSRDRVRAVARHFEVPESVATLRLATFDALAGSNEYAPGAGFLQTEAV